MSAAPTSAIWPTLLRLARWADAPVLWFGKAVSWLILPLILIIIIDALGRKFLRKISIVVENDWHGYLNSPVFQDSEWHLHAMIFLCGIGYAYTRNAHVRLDIFRHRLGPRGRLWAELLGGLLLLTPFFVIFAYHSWDFFWTAWLVDENSGVGNGIEHRWFIKFFIFLGPILLLLSGLSMILRIWVRLFGPEEFAKAAEIEKIADGSFTAFT